MDNHMITTLSMLKVIEEVMKLLNNIVVHIYVHYYTYNMRIVSLLFNDYANILEYPLCSPLVDWLCSIHMDDVAIDAYPVTTNMLAKNSNNNAQYNVQYVRKTTKA